MTYTLYEVVVSNTNHVAVAVEAYDSLDGAVEDALALWHEEPGPLKLMFVERDGVCAATLFGDESVHVTIPDSEHCKLAMFPPVDNPAYAVTVKVPRPT